jgi:predicted Zn-dependent protease
LAELGRFKEAKSALEPLRARDPTSPLVLNALGAIALMAGDPAGARRSFEQSLANDPTNVPARQALVVLNEPDNPTEALRLCAELQQLAPATPGLADCIRRNRTRIAK